MAWKTYRDRDTGKVGEFPEQMARVYPNKLVEVEPDAKPLAYVRISEPAVDELRARKKSKPKPEPETEAEISAQTEDSE